jgi:chromosome segregation protein
MYLSRLDLHGFKSFAERTSMQFDPGVTAVVGPNGCGKSNIVDAVRWVIGEQRARILRSDKMESVIFNGTAKKRPLGMAEVLLTIENNRGVLPVEFDEITIGRRLYRSGESEYLLNGIQCRLKDITDLFMDTGMGAGAYSVIELKMIEEILSDNALDRRRLFEEAAGITRYKTRRSQALKKLDNTQADLTRLKDLLDEIEKRVRSLKRQASTATRYKEVSSRLRKLELSLSRIEFDRLNGRRGDLERDIASLRYELEAQIARHGESEAALEATKLRLLEREEGFAAAQAELRAHLEDVQRLESELRLRDERIESGRRDLERSNREQAESEERVVGLDLEAASLEESISRVAPDVEAATDKLERAASERDAAGLAADEARTSLSALRAATQRSTDEAADRRRTLDREISRIELLEGDRQQCTESVTTVERELETTRAALDDATSLSTKRAEDVIEARADLDEALALESRLAEELNQLRHALQDQERRAEAKAAEVQLLESLVSSYDDATDAVRFLAEERGWSDHELITVADIIGCDDAWRGAVEAALGEYADCVVVRSDVELDHAVRKLREANRGRVTFIVLDRLPVVQSPDERIDGAQPLVRFVRALHPDYDNLAKALLRNAFVVDEIDPNTRLAPGLGIRVFTPSGEWLDDSGSVHVGSEPPAQTLSPRFGRREQLKLATRDHASLREAILKRQGEVEQAELAVAQVDAGSFRSLVAARELSAVEADKVAAQARFEYDAAQRRRSELGDRIKALGGTIDGLGQTIAALGVVVDEDLVRLGALKREAAAAEEVFHSTESESRVALARYSEANLAAVELRNQQENLQRDLDRAHDTLDALRGRIADRMQHITTVEKEIAESAAEHSQIEVQIAELMAQREALELAVDNRRNELHEGRTEIADIEATLREIRRAKEEHQREENQRAVKLAEVQTRVEELVRHIDEDYSVSIAEVMVDEESIDDESDARREVVELRRQVRSMGPINELALEEYAHEQERFDFLSQQLADLTEAERTLLTTIDEINTTASTRFMATFEAIRGNFSALFADLFGNETSAEVILEDPTDPLESAIEVMARPRGKRPSVLAQLSGGEKTLTAIALLFAIYLVKPSPFCILDEVDAPLDDANIGRFMQIIRKFSTSTQFILVTHNKRTMEAADRMYGVTMQEQGVSNLVGVKFEDVRETADSAIPEAVADYS